MAENLLITRMTSDDIDDVVLLDRSIFYDPWARTSFSGSLKKDTCLVLRRDGELEGYAIFSSIFDEGELLRIAVNPLSRRKGYATMLMNELSKLGRERNIEHWFLEVRAGNLGAIKLYEKFGFIMMGEPSDPGIRYQRSRCDPAYVTSPAHRLFRNGCCECEG